MTRTIGLTDYRRYCEALALPVDESLSPAARAAAVPPWMSPEIIATPAALQKLQAWNRQPAPARVEILERAAVIGDVDLAWQVAGIMAERIPAPVVHYAIERVVFYAVAHDTGVLGFTAPAGHGSRPWVVALSKAGGTAEQFGELCAH